jgi:nucleoside-diphosphate-sugar epimerase
MTRLLVTGARGFVGRAIMDRLRARGWDPIGVSSVVTGAFLCTNLLDHVAMRGLMRYVRPTHLIHAAWRPGHGNYLHSVENFAWLAASLCLIEAFREYGGLRAALLGTSAEYDWSQGICRNGITPTRPATLYGTCKNALRTTLDSCGSMMGLSLVWPRLFFLYGPGEHESRLVTSVIRSLVHGEPALCTHGRQVRDYLHVNDVAAGVVAALESKHVGSLDIASGQGVAVRDLVLTIARTLDREDLVRLGARPSPPHDVPMVVGDASEAATVLGWAPTISLPEGIAATIASERNVLDAAQDRRTISVTCRPAPHHIDDLV